MKLPRSWRVTVSSGGSPIPFKQGLTFPAVSSKDGTHTIVLLAYQIRVYYNSTRQCVRVVDLDIHDAIAAFIDDENDCQVIIFTSKQKVLYVNWKENVAHPVVARQHITPGNLHLQDIFLIDDTSYYGIGLSSEQSFASEHGPKTLDVYQIEKETAISHRMLTVPNVYKYGVSRSRNHLAVSKKGHVLIYDLKVGVQMMKRHITLELKSHLQNGSTSSASVNDVLDQTRLVMNYSGPPALALAVSDQGIAAVASTHGPIYLLYPQERDRKDSKDDSGNQRALKWHFEGAHDVAFSADQRYLVSGGSEKVLVIWNLELGKTQFLPRLSGSITAISIDPNRPDVYNIMLSPIAVGSGAVNLAQSEIVVISAVDLVSRLAVSSCRPQMTSTTDTFRRKVRQYLKKKEVVGAHDSDEESGNEDEEDQKQVSSKPRNIEKYDFIRPDISALTMVNFKTNHLYLPNGLSIQAFDLARGEQAFIQHVAPQLDIGRVKSEHKIVDPQVEKLAFTKNGKWMYTFDLMPKSDLDNLLSKNDTAFALKFWSWSAEDSQWHLALKIVDPHGPGLVVGAIVVLPTSEIVATVDSHGGVRIWRPRPAATRNNARGKTAATRSQTVWTLRRALPPSALAPAPVAAAWATDSSLLVVSHNTETKAYDPQLLEPVDFSFPRLSAPVEFVALLESHLVLALATLVLLFDLVKGEETSLAAKFLDYGARNLIAADTLRNIIAVAVNQPKPYEGQGFGCKILIFSPSRLSPVHEIVHKQLVVSLTALPSGFVFVDSASRASLISPVARDLDSTENLAEQMNNLLVNAQAAANVLHARSVDGLASLEVDDNNDTEKWTSQRLLDLAHIEPIFTNIDGIALDTLFERIVRAVQ